MTREMMVYGEPVRVLGIRDGRADVEYVADGKKFWVPVAHLREFQKEEFRLPGSLSLDERDEAMTIVEMTKDDPEALKNFVAFENMGWSMSGPPVDDGPSDRWGGW